MQIGIFAKTFVRSSLEGVFAAVADHGLSAVQFNMSCCGLSPMPDHIPEGIVHRVKAVASSLGIDIAAVSGTFNMIHPDVGIRRIGLSRLSILGAAARAMGARVVTLCTGTRNPENMWHSHPANCLEDAWSDLVVSMKEAIRIAEDNDITLAFEPETSNVVDSAKKARRLLDELESGRVKVVMDPANLLRQGQRAEIRAIMEDAFAMVGKDVALAHAKELSTAGLSGQERAGTGILNYDTYIRLLRVHGYCGPLVLHGLTEPQVSSSIEFIRSRLRST